MAVSVFSRTARRWTPYPENEIVPDAGIEREAGDAPVPEREGSEDKAPDEGEFGAQMERHQAAITEHPVRPPPPPVHEEHELLAANGRQHQQLVTYTTLTHS